MTGSNHVVAGALIATVVQQPVAAIPLAFLSHFVLDALPHYGDTDQRSWLNRHFSYVLIIDGLITTIFLMSILILQPSGWLVMIIAGLVAVSPDLLWLPYYLAYLKHEHKEDTKLAAFLKWIQWGERPWGIYVEVVWLVASWVLFAKIALG